MFGFLNVFGAAAFAQNRMNERLLGELVEEGDTSALQFTEDTLAWRGHALTAKQIASARASLGLSFGSCSFEEPVDGLRAAGLL
jgi:hypothetical protein